MDDQHLKEKSVTGVYTLPCGYVYVSEDGSEHLMRNVKLHEISGHEEDMIDREHEGGEAALIQELVAGCIVEISDDDGHSISIDDPFGKSKIREAVNNMLVSDITTLFIRLRQLTVGNRVKFDVKCTDPTCGTLFSQIADLSKVEIIDAEGDPIERDRVFTTNRGNVIKWRMMTGKMQQKAEADAVDIEAELKRRGGRKTTKAKMLKMKKESQATAFLLQRIVSVNDQEPTYQMLKDMSWGERQDIREQFDQEGGVDTEITVKCQCGNSFLTDISLTAKNFFSRLAE